MPEVKTVAYGSETIRYRGPKTWDLLPSEIKNAKPIVEFKKKSEIRSYKDVHADCVSIIFIIMDLCKYKLPILNYL